MREIKFRVWVKERNKMCSIDLYTSLCSKVQGVWEFGWEGSGRDVGNMKKIDGKNLILMQYTGLHDKNGKEIYEGDIVRTMKPVNGKIIGQIIFDSTFAIFQVLDGDGDEFDIYNVEVIGNIYENPELIK